MVNREHQADLGLPAVAKAIAADNEDAGWAMLFLLDGVRVPSAVLERMRLYGAVPEGYAEVFGE